MHASQSDTRSSRRRFIDSHEGTIGVVSESDCVTTGVLKVSFLGLGKVYGGSYKPSADLWKDTVEATEAAMGSELLKLQESIPSVWLKCCQNTWDDRACTLLQMIRWQVSKDAKLTTLILNDPDPNSSDTKIPCGHLVFDLEVYFQLDADGRQNARESVKAASAGLLSTPATERMLHRSKAAVLTRFKGYTADTWDSLSVDERASEFKLLNWYVGQSALLDCIKSSGQKERDHSSDTAGMVIASIPDVRQRIEALGGSRASKLARRVGGLMGFGKRT